MSYAPSRLEAEATPHGPKLAEYHVAVMHANVRHAPRSPDSIRPESEMANHENGLVLAAKTHSEAVIVPPYAPIRIALRIFFLWSALTFIRGLSRWASRVAKACDDAIWSRDATSHCS